MEMGPRISGEAKEGLIESPPKFKTSLFRGNERGFEMALNPGMGLQS